MRYMLHSIYGNRKNKMIRFRGKFTYHKREHPEKVKVSDGTIII